MIQNNNSHWLISRKTAIICLVVAGLVALAVAGHGGHILQAVPYLLLLACPLMHIFMHGHHHRSAEDQTKTDDTAPKKPCH